MTATHIAITGNLARDPEVKAIQSGALVTHFTVATTERRYNKESQQWEDAGDTIWWRVTAWDTLGERCADHLHKGDRVHVIGRLRSIYAYTSGDDTPKADPDLTAREVYRALPHQHQQPHHQQQQPHPTTSHQPWDDTAPF